MGSAWESTIWEKIRSRVFSKYDEYDKKRCHLQFIGHLQTNKVKQIVGKVELIQSVDSVKLAREIAKCSQEAGNHYQCFSRSQYWRGGK